MATADGVRAVKGPGAQPGGVRREVRGAIVIAAGVLVFSVLGGVVWGLLAPTEHLFVTQPGRGAPLTGESLHRFDALAIFVCVGAVVGPLSATAAWRWRSMRGPLLQIGLLIGSGVGACAMSVVGEWVAEAAHPRPANPPVGQIVTLPVEMGSWLALIVQPLLASLLVLFLAALSPAEDLGTGSGSRFGDDHSTGAGAYPPYDPVNGAALPYGGYQPVEQTGSFPRSGPAR